ncbi:MAG: hypothetical protein BIP78_1001 [Candidatus Bipolaricaulis sibiricus]|uniref:Monoacylglycerol lipase n=1 Tax=Bipolaricaulis sibiricus TaxID=2501609 RepID=A0A410FUL4_BIPS1|nr:MAG: hypothetical protein BIP78_1001 [Candidatus Bipolaricaulis sibiricus]
MGAMTETGGEGLTTADGLSLFVRSWPGAGRGVVGIVHGYGEHSGRYHEFARWLNELGWSVEACDLRGHGRSPGRRGHVARFGEYLLDVAALVRRLQDRAAGTPLFLFGHSLGGLIAVRYVEQEARGLTGLILSAPFLGVELVIPRWKRVVARVVSQVWPSLSTPSGLTGTTVSRDPEVIAHYEADPLMHKQATVRWFTEVIRTQHAALSEARRVSLPLLVLHGDADPIARVAVTRQFFAAVGSPDRTLTLYGGFLHEVLNEIGKERVWEDIAAWLDAHARTDDPASVT